MQEIHFNFANTALNNPNSFDLTEIKESKNSMKNSNEINQRNLKA